MPKYNLICNTNAFISSECDSNSSNTSSTAGKITYYKITFYPVSKHDFERLFVLVMVKLNSLNVFSWISFKPSSELVCLIIWMTLLNTFGIQKSNGPYLSLLANFFMYAIYSSIYGFADNLGYLDKWCLSDIIASLLE